MIKRENLGHQRSAPISDVDLALIEHAEINAFGIRTPLTTDRQHRSARGEISFANVDIARAWLAGQTVDAPVSLLRDQIAADTGGAYVAPGELLLAAILAGLQIDTDSVRAPDARIFGRADVFVPRKSIFNHRGQGHGQHEHTNAA